MTTRPRKTYTRRADRLHHVLVPETMTEIHITERQYQILVLLGGGLKVRGIAQQLRISEQDVRNRLNRLTDRTGLNRDGLTWLGKRLAHE